MKFFNYPKKVRVDAEGAWMSTETNAVLGSLGIDLDPIVGEAHWQLGVAEVSIKLVKTTMDKLARPHPTRPVKEILSRSFAALNAQELVCGYSPL